MAEGTGAASERGSGVEISKEQEAFILTWAWRGLVVAGAVLALARFLNYIDNVTTFSLGFIAALSFWSLWAAGVALLFLGGLSRGSEMWSRVMYTFFGILVLANA